MKPAVGLEEIEPLDNLLSSRLRELVPPQVIFDMPVLSRLPPRDRAGALVLLATIQHLSGIDSRYTAKSALCQASLLWSLGFRVDTMPASSVDVALRVCDGGAEA